ncbi:MAG: prepilin-type N-terminal cleavage/methylation domain-containing protein [Methylococcales bacterium]|nr:prepilin-type N-terminal cleavage/methylation domain-containing protein [Methylococcales bacterium]
MTTAKDRTYSRQQGFTLVEMAVVLVIIGIILGGVTIGQDLIRDAEHQKMYQKFVLAWKQIYDQYHQRTGVVLGDNPVAPTMMVNGAEAVLMGLGGQVSGLPENYARTGRRICQGQGYGRDAVGSGDPELARQGLLELVTRAGLTLPSGRSKGQEDRYLYLDSQGNPSELQICFQWNRPGRQSGSGNVMVLRGLTIDLAQKLDLLIDERVNAAEGRFREQVTHNFQTDKDNEHEWGAVRLAIDKDEKPQLVTAHWSMDR